MEQWKGKVAVVTGVSAGIGLAIVEALVGHGMKVVGCARNKERVDALATKVNKKGPGEMFPFRCDVTDEAEVQSMFKFIKDTFGALHVCVNNAGLAYDAPITSGKTKEWQQMVNVNIIGLCICTREAVQLMQASGVNDGHIINMNSVSGHRQADKPLYTCTKHAVTQLCEGTRRELRGMDSDIRTTSISPGFVETEFAYRLYSDDPEKAKRLYSTYPCLQADDIAQAVVYALSAPKHVDINEIIIRPTRQPL